ncbi:MAG: glutamate--cysteine ligase [Pseudomonadota bacterium]
MYATLNRRLGHLEQVRDRTLFARARQGVEKESLRVTGDGEIAQTPHPIALGSTLTHASITTDYSEALLEFITPPLGSPDEAVSMLCEIHRFTIANLGAERLWATSMPCVVHGDDGVPIAVYGSSNSGTLRHVYRRGLALRYGRVMQVISGVHFNFSLPEAFWTALHQLEAPQSSLRDYIDEGYLGLIRNVLRYGWLVLYLFGASPAVCRSFLGKDNERFSRFDDHTRYEPFATSLRMSDIGYSNRNPAGLDVSYDSLGEYIESLARAIETPYPPYERIGVVGADGYQQLNANILQIENEYYSTVRPKRPPARGEKPTIALRDQGVEYIELRSLDVDPYSPCGVDAQTLRFLETFLWFCAAHESPPMDSDERAKASQTLTDVAYRPGPRTEACVQRRQKRGAGLCG